MIDLSRTLVTVEKAAELASVTKGAIYDWARQGKIETVLTAGDKIRVYADSLFKEHVREPTSEEREAAMVAQLMTLRKRT